MEANNKKLLPDEARSLLKASLARRRVPRRTILLVVLLLFGIPLGLAAWYFWPRPGPPQVRIVALDVLCVPGDEVQLRAQVSPDNDEPAPARLGGWAVAFQEKAAAFVPGRQPWFAATKTNAGGDAAVTWQAPGERRVQMFAARYEPEHKSVSVEDAGWVYCLPPQTPLLIVDVSSATELADAIPKKQYQPIYLAGPSSQPADYWKTRAWVTSHALPAGPVLARSDFRDADAAADRLAALVEQIRSKFTGKIAGVTAERSAAVVFQKQGLSTFLVGKDQPGPPGVTALSSWSELPKHLSELRK